MWGVARARALLCSVSPAGDRHSTDTWKQVRGRVMPEGPGVADAVQSEVGVPAITRIAIAKSYS